MEKLRFLVIGIGPWERPIVALLVYQGEIGIDPVPKIDPVRKILTGCEDESFFVEHSRIDIDPPVIPMGKLIFQGIGPELYIRQGFGPDEVEKSGRQPLETLSHFTVVIIRIGKRPGSGEEIDPSEILLEHSQSTGQGFRIHEQKPNHQFYR